jgi:hypothetical protein
MFSDSVPLQASLTDVELRQVIDRLSRKIDYLYRAMGIPYPDDDLPGYVMQARELILLDRDSEAVKVVREHTAVGIVEARAIVEDMRRRLRRGPVEHPVVTPQQVHEAALAAESAPAWTAPTATASMTAVAPTVVASEAPRLSADEIWADDASALVS